MRIVYFFTRWMRIIYFLPGSWLELHNKSTIVPVSIGKFLKLKAKKKMKAMEIEFESGEFYK